MKNHEKNPESFDFYYDVVLFLVRKNLVVINLVEIFFMCIFYCMGPVKNF